MNRFSIPCASRGEPDDQSYDKGDTIEAGSEIDLVISLGPEPVPEP